MYINKTLSVICWISDDIDQNLYLTIVFCFLFVCCVRLLSVLRGHSFFSSSPQRPMTSDFEGFLYLI